MKPADASRPELHPETDQALAWLHRSGAETELLTAVRTRVRSRRRRNATVGATLAALIIAATWTWRSTPHHDVAAPVAANRTPTASVSAPRRETLPDGSVVELKADAAVTADFSGPLRHVTLVRGEAHFQVAKNPARPFVVHAAGVEVRAVGTAFAVDLGAHAVEVVVTEGRVSVNKPAPGDAAPATPSFGPAPLLDAGHRAVIPLSDAQPEVSQLAGAQLAQRLAWRVPQLEFTRTPLAEIVALMNAYAAAHGGATIRLAPESAELRELELSGLLAADNTDGLVRILERTFPVRAERDADGIVLRRIAAP